MKRQKYDIFISYRRKTGLDDARLLQLALNALEEETGSSVFTAAYTIPYVIGNILLTIMGSIVVEFVR